MAATSTDLAEALAAATPAERRAALEEAQRLRLQRCCAPDPRTELMNQRDAQRAAKTAKALADPVRMQIVDLLRRRGAEICQCDLQPLFDLSQPTLSHHLRKLADAGLVTVERRGKWAFYAINDTTLEEMKSWLS